VLCPPGLPARHHRHHPGGPLGDHPDQPTVSPVGSTHWPGSGRLGVRREYYHEPGAPAATCVVPYAFVAVRDIAGRCCCWCAAVTPVTGNCPGGASSQVRAHPMRRSGRPPRNRASPWRSPAWSASTPTLATSSPTREPGWSASRFAACFRARPRSGSPGGDDVETSDARWIAIGDISALPIRPAMRIRIAHALTPGRPRHID
jgi:8-oxo-dGTP diphosphatase